MSALIGSEGENHLHDKQFSDCLWSTMTIAISVQTLHAKVFDKVDTLAPNAVPKRDVSTSPIDEGLVESSQLKVHLEMSQKITKKRY